MKKYLTHFALACVVSSAFFISGCNKSEVSEQLNASTITDDDDEVLPSGKCGCDCPSSVATATSINYAINFTNWPDVLLTTDVYYKNAGPEGTLKVVLRNANGEINSVSVVPAYHTAGNDSSMIHLEYMIDYDNLPAKLHVKGRPANLDCSTRSKIVFDIINDVSRY